MVTAYGERAVLGDGGEVVRGGESFRLRVAFAVLVLCANCFAAVLAGTKAWCATCLRLF